MAAMIMTLPVSLWWCVVVCLCHPPHRYVNTVAADNTARAIEAAATGQIPTSYATRYGSYQAQTAANWNDCWNCKNW